MSQQVVNNNDSGLVSRTKINANFTELYGALNFPLRLLGISGNSTLVIPANTLLLAIVIRPDSGAPVLSLGTSPGGGDILGSQAIPDVIPMLSLIPFLTGGTIYATLSGGIVDVFFLTISHVF